MKPTRLAKARSPDLANTMMTRSPPRPQAKPKKPLTQTAQTISNVNLHMNIFNVNAKMHRGASTEKLAGKQVEKRSRISTTGALSVSRSDAFLQKANPTNIRAFSRSHEKVETSKVRRSVQKISEPKLPKSRGELSVSGSINIGTFLSNPQDVAANFATFAKKEAKKWGRVEEVLFALKSSLPIGQKQTSTILDQLGQSVKRAKKSAKKVAVGVEKASKASIDEATTREPKLSFVEEPEEFLETGMRDDPQIHRSFAKKETPASDIKEQNSPPQKKRQTVFNLSKPTPISVKPEPISQAETSPVKSVIELAPKISEPNVRPFLLPPPNNIDPIPNRSGVSSRSPRIAMEQWKTPPKSTPNALSQLLDCRNGSISMRDSRKNLSEISRHQYSIISQNFSAREQDALPLTTSAVYQPELVLESNFIEEPKLTFEKQNNQLPPPEEFSDKKATKSTVKTQEKSPSKIEEGIDSKPPTRTSSPTDKDQLTEFVENCIFDSLTEDPLIVQLFSSNKEAKLNAIFIKDDAKPNESCEVAYAIRTHHIAIREYLTLIQRPFIDLFPYISKPDFAKRSRAEFEAHEKLLLV